MIALAALLAATFGVAACLSRWLASPQALLKILDHPNDRSLHTAAKPRTGGLAILISVIAGCLLSIGLARSECCGHGFIEGARALSSPENAVMLAALLIVAGTSFRDDLIGVSPGARFGLQVLAAVAVVAAGAVLRRVPLPILGELELGWIAPLVSVLFIVWMANLFNFMDGMDGFAGGMGVSGFGFLGALALYHGHLEIALLSLLIMAAAGGFLVFNYPPARIFMGDVGSVPLGFLAAVLCLRASVDGLFDVWVPALIFSPFIADATVVLVRRALTGERIWEAHRQHAYQRLVLAGWSQRRTVWFEYLLMLASGTAAIAYISGSDRIRPLILIACAATYALLFLGVHLVAKTAVPKNSV